MSEPIKVGDLVVVVRWPCCGEHLGRVFRVASMRHSSSIGNGCWQCSTRTERYEGTLALESAFGFRSDVVNLKRIPPLSELESEKNKEELTA